MIIQHNLPAMNAHRQMGINNNNITKSLEKLSSGFRINRAGDDAAGLAISEKMRGQISGLDQAASNAQDAISLIQTAEGALNETHSILQRMRTLSVQSSNGTYDDTTDRANIEKELTALKSELDRISTATQFNTKNLLDGTYAARAVVPGQQPVGPATAGQDGVIASTGKKAVYDLDLGATAFTAGKTVSFMGATVTVAAGAVTASAVATQLATALNAITTGSAASQFTAVATGNKIELTAKTAGARTDTLTATTTETGRVIADATVVQDGINTGGGAAANTAITTLSFDADLLSFGDTFKIGSKTFEFTNGTTVTTTGNAAINIGAALTAYNAATAVTATITQAFAAAVNTAMGTALTAGGITGQGLTNPVNGAVNGTFSLTLTATDAGVGGNIGDVRISTTTAGAMTSAVTKLGTNAGVGVAAKFATASIELDLTKFSAGDKIEIGGREITVVEAGKVTDNTKQIAMDNETNMQREFLAAITSTPAATNAQFNNATFNGKTLTLEGVTAGQTAANFVTSLGVTSTVTPVPGAPTTAYDSGITFQVGANGSADQRVTLNIGNMDTKSLGVLIQDGTKVDKHGDKIMIIDGTKNINKISFAGQEAANAAITVIDAAINQVSGTRADLGALQNRFEHTINSLGVASENLQAAESRVRDVDMAKEMMTFTKNQIIAQASQAMLAQANALPQGVLQLLK